MAENFEIFEQIKIWERGNIVKLASLSHAFKTVKKKKKKKKRKGKAIGSEKAVMVWVDHRRLSDCPCLV